MDIFVLFCGCALGKVRQLFFHQLQKTNSICSNCKTKGNHILQIIWENVSFKSFKNFLSF